MVTVEGGGNIGAKQVLSWLIRLFLRQHLHRMDFRGFLHGRAIQKDGRPEQLTSIYYQRNCYGIGVQRKERYFYERLCNA